VGVGVELVLEVLVEAALGHTGGGGDAIDRGPGVGTGGELGLESVHDAGAFVLGKAEKGGVGHDDLL